MKPIETVRGRGYRFAIPRTTAKTNESESPRRPFSLAARAAITTGFVLAAFLGAVGWTLSQANKEPQR